ncbi:unnamed protein product [Closterium sp. Yama58-4]|nr:unnamed protein product [Closterium sp. Yama58-4]
MAETFGHGHPFDLMEALEEAELTGTAHRTHSATAWDPNAWEWDSLMLLPHPAGTSLPTSTTESSYFPLALSNTQPHHEAQQDSPLNSQSQAFPSLLESAAHALSAKNPDADLANPAGLFPQLDLAVSRGLALLTGDDDALQVGETAGLGPKRKDQPPTAADSDCPNFRAGRVPCECTQADAQLAVKRQRFHGRGGPFPGARASSGRKGDKGARKRGADAEGAGSQATGGSGSLRCQVDGCDVLLSTLREYHQRHRVCEAHAKAGSVVHEGIVQRYCQQCGRFHPIGDFDEARRSCRRKLQRHNNLRKHKALKPPTPAAFPLPPSPPNTTADERASPEKSSSGGSGGDGAGGETGAASGEAETKRNVAVEALRGRASDGIARGGGGENGPKLRHEGDFQGERVGGERKVGRAMGVREEGEEVKQKLSLVADGAVSPHGAHAARKARETCNEHEAHGVLNADASASASMHSDTGDSNGDAGTRRALGLARGNGDGGSAAADPPGASPTAPVTATRTPPSNIPMARFAPPPPSPASRSLAGPLSFAPFTPFPVPPPQPISDPACPARTPAAAPPGALRQAPAEEEESQQKQQEQQQQVKGRGQGMEKQQQSEGERQTKQGSAQGEQREGVVAGDESAGRERAGEQHQRTGRISLKLYDWNPGDFPRHIRNQILEWLSCMPSDLEGYIRPGCTHLTLFARLPAHAWSQMEKQPSPFLDTLLHPSQPLSLHSSSHSSSALPPSALAPSSAAWWSVGCMAVQLGSHTMQQRLLVDHGVIRASTQLYPSPSAPLLHRPRGLLALPLSASPSRLVLRASNLPAAARVLCSLAGRYLVNTATHSHTQATQAHYGGRFNHAGETGEIRDKRQLQGEEEEEQEEEDEEEEEEAEEEEEEEEEGAEEISVVVPPLTVWGTLRVEVWQRGSVDPTDGALQ